MCFCKDKKVKWMMTNYNNNKIQNDLKFMCFFINPLLYVRTTKGSAIKYNENSSAKSDHSRNEHVEVIPLHRYFHHFLNSQINLSPHTSAATHQHWVMLSS